MGEFLETIGEAVPSFVGIKFTSTNLEEGGRALRADNEKFVIFLGSDQVFVNFLLVYKKLQDNEFFIIFFCF